MELKQKGQAANLATIKQAMITLKWTTEADFDLAACYEKKDGTAGMIYFGDLGDLNTFPFMQLSGDAGVGDAGGDNEETMRITKVDDSISAIHIVCWDYGAVSKGQPARFAGSDVSLSFMDDSGTNHNLNLDTGDAGNTCVLATLKVSPLGAELINTSKAGTLKELKNVQQIVDIANS